MRITAVRESGTWIATILATLTVFGPLSMDLYLPVLPALADDLRTTASAAQLTMTTCLLGLAFGQLLAGPLSDRFGRRVPLIVGLIVYTVSSTLCAVSGDISVLIAARLLQGLAGGVGLVIAQASGRDLYSGAKLTRYYGRIVVLSGLAAVVAPLLGGVLALVLDWRGFFVLLAGIGVVVTACVALGFGETLHPAARTRGGVRDITSNLALLMSTKQFVGATVSSSLSSAAYFAYLAGAPFILQNVYSLSPVPFSIVFAINAGGFALFGFAAGRASERWGERTIFGVGLALLGLGACLAIIAAFAVSTLTATVAAFFFIAAGAAAVSPPSTTLALTDHPRIAGTASSILGVTRFAAGAAAAPLVGLAGSNDPRPTAVVAIITTALAVIAYVALVRPRPTV